MHYHYTNANNLNQSFVKLPITPSNKIPFKFNKFAPFFLWKTLSDTLTPQHTTIVPGKKGDTSWTYNSTFRVCGHETAKKARKQHSSHCDLVSRAFTVAQCLLPRSFTHVYSPEASRRNGRSIRRLGSMTEAQKPNRSIMAPNGEHLVSYQISRSRIRDEVFGCLSYGRGTYDYRRGILEESGGAATNGGIPTLNLAQRPARPTSVARRARKFN